MKKSLGPRLITLAVLGLVATFGVATATATNYGGGWVWQTSGGGCAFVQNWIQDPPTYRVATTTYSYSNQGGGACTAFWGRPVGYIQAQVQLQRWNGSSWACLRDKLPQYESNVRQLLRVGQLDLLKPAMWLGDISCRVVGPCKGRLWRLARRMGTSLSRDELVADAAMVRG